MKAKNRLIGCLLWITLAVGCSQRDEKKSQVQEKPMTKKNHVPKIVRGVVSINSKEKRPHQVTKDNQDSMKLGKNNGLMNAIVYVSNPPKSIESNVSNEPLILKHEESKYVPRVVAARTGQGIEVINADKIMHTDHVISSHNKQFGKAFDGGPSRFVFNEPEVFLILQCDVHRTERAIVAVFDHSFYAISGESGEYIIKEPLPAGKYVITAKHEVLGSVEREIVIEGNEGELKLDIVFEVP